MISPQTLTLANGVRVVCDPSPGAETLAVSVVAGAGARHESSGQAGWAHLLEHMVFKAAGGRSARAIVEAVEGAGGHLNAFTGHERTSFQIRALAGSAPLATEILSDLLFRPALDEADLEREKGVVLQEIAEAADAPDDLVFERAAAAAFPRQGLGRPILGLPRTIQAATAAALGAFRQTLYAPSRLVVSASGAVDPEAFFPLAEAWFSDAEGAPAPEPPQALFVGGASVVARRLEQAHVAVFLPAPSARDADAYAARLTAEILGGGMSSRLFQSVREDRGLVYAIDAFYEGYGDTGLVGVAFGAGAGTAAEAADLVGREIARLIGRTPDAEISRAKAQMKGALHMALESYPARAEQWAVQLLTHGRIRLPGDIAARIDAVQPADLERVASRVLESGRFAGAVVGPRAAGATLDAFASGLFGPGNHA